MNKTLKKLKKIVNKEKGGGKVFPNKFESRREKACKIFLTFSKSIHNIKFTDSFSKAIDLIKNCNGKIVTTGMGKAGAATRKFTSTLCSLGFPSCFLHPGEAGHGDLGLLQPKDILFVASTSGKTREVVEIIDLAKKIGIKQIIGITSHPDSLIREKCDCVLDMGIIEEAGDLKMAPTTSIIVMTAIMDCLAVIASEENKFTKKDFGKFHHAGYLGDVARMNTGTKK